MHQIVRSRGERRKREKEKKKKDQITGRRHDKDNLTQSVLPAPRRYIVGWFPRNIHKEKRRKERKKRDKVRK